MGARRKKAYEIPIMYVQHKSKADAGEELSFESFRKGENLILQEARWDP